MYLHPSFNTFRTTRFEPALSFPSIRLVVFFRVTNPLQALSLDRPRLIIDARELPMVQATNFRAENEVVQCFFSLGPPAGAHIRVPAAVWTSNNPGSWQRHKRPAPSFVLGPLAFSNLLKARDAFPFQACLRTACFFGVTGPAVLTVLHERHMLYCPLQALSSGRSLIPNTMEKYRDHLKARDGHCSFLSKPVFGQLAFL
jgi:hypothetical protein